MDIYELSEKEFQITILRKPVNYKRTQTTKQNQKMIHEKSKKVMKIIKRTKRNSGTEEKKESLQSKTDHLKLSSQRKKGKIL